MRLIWSFVFFTLASAANLADEPMNIKGIYLGMSVAELEDLLSTDIYCELAPMDTHAACATTTNLDGGRSATLEYQMTIAGQDCKLRHIEADNDGVGYLDTAELFIYYVTWFCDSDSDVIERAIKRKYGKPTTEEVSESAYLPVTWVTWEFRTEWEQQPKRPSESEPEFIARTKFPQKLELMRGDSPTMLTLDDTRVGMLVNIRKKTRELEDI